MIEMMRSNTKSSLEHTVQNVIWCSVNVRRECENRIGSIAKNRNVTQRIVLDACDKGVVGVEASDIIQGDLDDVHGASCNLLQ